MPWTSSRDGETAVVACALSRCGTQEGKGAGVSSRVPSASRHARGAPTSCFFGVPQVGIQLALLALQNPHLSQCQDLSQVEYFAGRHEVKKAAWAAGREAIPYERDLDPVGIDFRSKQLKLIQRDISLGVLPPPRPPA